MVKFEYVLHNPQGLHARPVGELVSFVSKFSCEVVLHHGIRFADARNPFALMALAVHPGGRIIVEVFGPKEEETARALKAFFHQNLY